MVWQGEENPYDYGMEEELERETFRRAGYVPSFCRTEDEYREFLSGDLTEWELGQRRAVER